MKFAFAAALIAVANAAEWGHQQPIYQTTYVPQYRHIPATESTAASQAAQTQKVQRAGAQYGSYGRDQDLSIDESYGSTQAKSYRAESYDEWDNQDNDKQLAQAWGKDRDQYGASSKWGAASRGNWDMYGKAAQGSAGYSAPGQYAYGAQAGRAYGEDDGVDASKAYAASQGGYDNDEWAKQAAGSDYDSRWGKSYDSVDAKSYDNTWYARDVRADDDQWAEDLNRFGKRDVGAYGAAASAGGAASAAGAAGYWGKQASDWDAWGSDQDYKEKISYDQTRAKAYSAESFDAWDNRDDDKYGAQAWGKDRDVYGASSYGKAASMKDVGQYGGYGAAAGAQGQAYGGYYGGKGLYAGGASQSSAAAGQYGKGSSVWQGASAAAGAAQAGYDNDEWAKQAHGSDYDSRWGKSYDRVSARSYENEQYARDLQVDHDVWAEDYDRYDDRDAYGYGAAASKTSKSLEKGGWDYYGRPTTTSQASRQAGREYDGSSAADFDAMGRDQDLSVQESYDMTWAKSYDAESFDEWDNKDNDQWGTQSWGKDRDIYG